MTDTNEVLTFAELYIVNDPKVGKESPCTLKIGVEEKETGNTIMMTTDVNMVQIENGQGDNDTMCLDDPSPPPVRFKSSEICTGSFYWSILNELVHRENHHMDMDILVTKVGEKKYLFEFITASKIAEPLFHAYVREDEDDSSILISQMNTPIPKSSGWYFLAYHFIDNYKKLTRLLNNESHALT